MKNVTQSLGEILIIITLIALFIIATMNASYAQDQDGDGVIQFLPKDIKGLTTKLELLLAEFAAWIRSSICNEIVSIVDKMRGRKNISRKEYIWRLILISHDACNSTQRWW